MGYDVNKRSFCLHRVSLIHGIFFFKLGRNSEWDFNFAQSPSPLVALVSTRLHRFGASWNCSDTELLCFSEIININASIIYLLVDFPDKQRELCFFLMINKGLKSHAKHQDQAINTRAILVKMFRRRVF